MVEKKDSYVVGKYELSGAHVIWWRDMNMFLAFYVSVHGPFFSFRCYKIPVFFYGIYVFIQ
jgi:hypothetical protein